MRKSNFLERRAGWGREKLSPFYKQKNILGQIIFLKIVILLSMADSS